MNDPWTVDGLDLDAYLARAGAAAEAPGIDAIARLQLAHALTFTFDNLDVLLGTHPGVGLEAEAWRQRAVTDRHTGVGPAVRARR